MDSRMKEYKIGNFKHKLLSYIPLKIDRKQIEKCVKMRLKPHLMKLITDTVCYTSLKELKENIIDCINFNLEHICHCVKCSKIYDIKSLDKHTCNIVTIDEFIDYDGQKTSKKTSKKSSKKTSKKFSKNPSKKPPKKFSKKPSKKFSKKSSKKPSEKPSKRFSKKTPKRLSKKTFRR